MAGTDVEHFARSLHWTGWNGHGIQPLRPGLHGRQIDAPMHDGDVAMRLRDFPAELRDPCSDRSKPQRDRGEFARHLADIAAARRCSRIGFSMFSVMRLDFVSRTDTSTARRACFEPPENLGTTRKRVADGFFPQGNRL